MPSVGMQMPQLYLRGSLCNVTMANLTIDQQSQLSKIVDEIINDPQLQPARYQFKNALRYTIKGDYEIPEAADQEYQIAIWKAAVAAKFGWGTHEPSEEAINDPTQRKKFFQTWVFNYLRQIINENKRLTRKTTKIVEVSIIEACKIDIVELLKDQCKIVKDYSRELEIFCDMFMLPSKMIDNLSSIKSKYFTKGIQFIINDDNIIIKNIGETGVEMVEINTTMPINTISTSSKSKDEDKNSIPELAAVNTNEFDDPETITNFIDNLSDDAKLVISVIVNTPEDYIKKYGDKPVKKYIAEYLNFNQKQVKEVWSELRMVYCDVIGVPEVA